MAETLATCSLIDKGDVVLVLVKFFLIRNKMGGSVEHPIPVLYNNI